MVVVTHIDHLSNTVLGENLTSPDKILRMLLKIEGLVKLQWKFSPGNTQIGDRFSRNPEDRYEVRGESEGKAHMPRTLAEAFAASTGTTLEGNRLTDDAGAFTQHFGNRINATSHRSDGADLELEEPGLMKELRLLGRSEPGAYYAARTTKTGGNVSAVMFPPGIGDLLDPAALYGYALLGKDVSLRSVRGGHHATIRVSLGREELAGGIGSSPPPRPKALQRKLRTTLLDGVLLALRTKKQAVVTAAVSFGEGSIVLMTVLSPELRKAA